MPDRPPCLAAATHYLERGWSPIALCPPDHQGVTEHHKTTCRKPGKCPMWPWKEYQNRLPRQSELNLFWNRCPASNVGIILGSITGMIALDIDGPKGQDLLDTISQNNLPRTLAFTTGAGRRLLFKYPAKAKIKTFPVDGKEAFRILANGSQTAAPPSIHQSGTKYTWMNDLPPAEPPDWLMNLLEDSEDPAGDCQVSEGVILPMSQTTKHERIRRYLDKCQPAISGRGGHNQLFKTACKIVKLFPITEQQAVELLMSFYNPRCQPRWTESEIRHKVKDAMLQAGQPQEKATIEATTITMANVQTRAIKWLWPQIIPLGKITILDGDPDYGKSTLLLDIAARVSRDGIMPDNLQGECGNVVIMSAEDDLEDTIKPRLLAAGANLSRVHSIEDIKGQPPTIPQDIPYLEEQILKYEAKLLILDTLTSYLDADTHIDQKVRKALYPLRMMLKRRNCTAIGLRHLNKSTATTKAIYRGGGSIAIIGAARAGLMVARDPDNPNAMILAHHKHNLSTEHISLRYALQFVPEHSVCKIQWLGTSTIKADDLLKQPEETELTTQREEAISLIQEMMAEGPRPAADIYQAAKEAKISEKTLKRAKAALKVKTTPIRDGNNKLIGWLWSPGDPLGGQIDASA